MKIYTLQNSKIQSITTSEDTLEIAYIDKSTVYKKTAIAKTINKLIQKGYISRELTLNLHQDYQHLFADEASILPAESVITPFTITEGQKTQQEAKPNNNKSSPIYIVKKSPAESNKNIFFKTPTAKSQGESPVQAYSFLSRPNVELQLYKEHLISDVWCKFIHFESEIYLSVTIPNGDYAKVPISTDLKASILDCHTIDNLLAILRHYPEIGESIANKIEDYQACIFQPT